MASKMRKRWGLVFVKVDGRFKKVQKWKLMITSTITTRNQSPKRLEEKERKEEKSAWGKPR